MKGNSDLYREIPVEDENTGTPLMEEPFNPSEINIDIKSPTISIIIDRLSQNPPEIDLTLIFNAAMISGLSRNRVSL